MQFAVYLSADITERKLLTVDCSQLLARHNYALKNIHSTSSFEFLTSYDNFVNDFLRSGERITINIVELVARWSAIRWWKIMNCAKQQSHIM